MYYIIDDNNASEMKVEWSDSFSVGNEIIDLQHKKLIKILNEVVEANRGDNDLSITEAIGELYDYVNYHFDYEENLLKISGYPGLESHIKKHERFTLELMTFSQKISNSKKDFFEEFRFWLMDWLLHHILSEDKKFVEHLHMCGKVEMINKKDDKRINNINENTDDVILF